MGDRLREERLRLGKNQAEFAEAGGVKNVAQSRYESGERQPDMAYLQGIAAVGADCQYIVTGVRSINLRDVERAAHDKFTVQYPAVLKLHDINAGVLADVLFEVTKACDTFPQLQDLTYSDKARAVAEIYLERMGLVGARQDASLIAAVVRKAS